MPVTPKPGTTKISRPIRIRPSRNNKNASHTICPLTWECDQKNKRKQIADNARQADAGHLQFQNQACDADHDQHNARPGGLEEIDQAVQPIGIGRVDLAGIDAFQLAQVLKTVDGVAGHAQLPCLFRGQCEILILFFIVGGLDHADDLPALLATLVRVQFGLTEEFAQLSSLALLTA